MVAYCGRCKRRKVVEYELPEEVKRLLLLYRWKTGVCLPCVDELAEKGGIRYRPENLEATTWADLPALDFLGPIAATTVRTMMHR
jgi:hypothetical protein